MFDTIASNGMRISYRGLNAYFALASFRTPLHRTADNVLGIRSLWVDLDAGKERAPYATMQDALASLVKFSKDTGLKPSIIVSSGLGIHAYWCMDTTLTLPQWQKIARVFHALCLKHDLKVDPARAEDGASVLRIPGTKHVKTGNVVSVLFEGQDYAIASLIPTLTSQMPDPETYLMPKKAPSRPVEGFAEAMASIGMGNMVPRPHRPNADRIVANCPQLLTMGFGDYNQWFACMSVLKSCENGRDWAHKLSAMDTVRYEYGQTDKKFDAVSEDMPALCSTLNLIAPNRCTQCRFKGQVKSPIRLLDVIPAQPAQPAEPDPVQTPPAHLDLTEKEYPAILLEDGPFTVDHRGIVWHKSEKQSDGTYAIEDHVICNVQLFYKHSVVAERESGRPERLHVFEAVYPTGSHKLLRFSIKDDYNPRTIITWFANGEMYSTDMSLYGASVFMNFINAYLQRVAQVSPELMTMDKFGWTQMPVQGSEEEELGFVTGSGVVTKTGLKDVWYDAQAEFHRAELTTKGSIDAWREGVSMYKTLDQKVGQFALCLGFAAPLMKYASGEATSAVFSLYSAESGLGKTQLMRAVASIWGDPYKQFISRSASPVAKTRKLAVLQNLPVFMDEMTDVPDSEIYGLAYTLAGGKEKDKLHSSGAKYIKTGKWTTVSFLTANKSMKGAIAREAGDSDATLLRVLEYNCDFQSYENDPDKQQYIFDCMHKVKDNYGIAGPEFIYSILRNADRLNSLTGSVEHWVDDHAFRSNERFISNAMALAIIAGRWACEFGLIDFDMDALERWVLTTLTAQNRDDTASYAPDARALLVDYIMDRQANMLVVTNSRRPAKMADPGVRGLPDGFIVSAPNKNIEIRAERDDKIMYIAMRDLTDWCAARRIGVRTLIEKLGTFGIKPEKKYKDLSTGISWLNLPTTRCYKLTESDLNGIGYGIPETGAGNE